MRKSDKLKNFKKANLLVENRYLESKGFINENLTSEDVLINTIESKLKEIENGSLPKEVGIGIYLRQLEVMNPEMYDLYSEKYKNVIRHSNIGLDEDYLYEDASNEMDLESNPRLLDSIVSQISDIVAPYVGLGVGDKTISNHNLEAILTAFNQRFSRSSKFQDEFGKEYSKTPSLDEENIFSRAGKKISDFGHRLLDIPTKEEEAKKEQAIDEIIKFDFKDLFYQPYEGELLNAETANRLIGYAAKAMPTVKELNPILFEIKGGYFSNAIMEKDGKRIRGVIPSCFEPIRDVNDEINNEEAIRRMIGYLG